MIASNWSFTDQHFSRRWRSHNSYISRQQWTASHMDWFMWSDARKTEAFGSVKMEDLSMKFNCPIACHKNLTILRCKEIMVQWKENSIARFSTSYSVHIARTSRVATFFFTRKITYILLPWGIQKSTLNKLKVDFNLLSFYFFQTYFLLLLALQSKFLLFRNISMASLHSIFILKYINNSFFIRLREALFLSSPPLYIHDRENSLSKCWCGGNR